jgi:acetyl coenzyme A synthetase (ADP forming)-like protein
MAPVDALLADGGVVQVRPIAPADAPMLERFHDALSPETNRLRFFVVRPHLDEKSLSSFTNVDHHDREALIALSGGELIGVARYDRYPGTADAEVAFVVADAWQGSGVGSLLLEHLAARARAEGLERFVAETLAENSRMMRVFFDSGLAPTQSWQSGVAHLVMPLVLSGAAVEVINTREQRSEARSVEHLVRPRSIAVIGASSRPDGVGHVILRSLLDAGFNGPVHPVNARGEEVEGLPGFASVDAIDGDVDLAIVAVGADKVVGLVPSCAAKGVRGLVVISGGFAESGTEGAQRQRELAAAARAHGMRIIGPNCVGIVNTDPEVRLDATFAATKPKPGRVGLASQSGAVGIAVLDAATRAGIGISTFVSLGNKADVSSNDLLQYWEDDDQTDVVLLYLESFGNPAKFARLARRLGRRKPIIAVKSGRTAAGRRAASSHTAAMAADDDAVHALLLQCGVVRVDTTEELLDSALVLAHQPVPAGARVAIVGNSGGPGIMGADACGRAGLELAELSENTKDALRATLAAASSVNNPVDLLGDAGPSIYSGAIATVAADDAVDALIVIHSPVLVANTDAVAAAIASAAAHAKPVVAVLVGRDRSILDVSGNAGVPVFGAIEQAVLAVGHAAAYGRWRARPPEAEPLRDDLDTSTTRRLVEEVLTVTPAGRWLTQQEVTTVLRAYGVPVVRSETVSSVDAATRAAQGIGYPIALKADGPDVLHKTDVGGVALGLRSARDIERAWEAMQASVGPAMTGALVQAMAEPGVELIAGVVRDATFGPLVLVGMGGTMAELIGDRVVRIAPVTDTEADEAVRSLRCAPLLTGYRGSAPVDIGSVVDVVVRLGLLARDVPHISELDCNPLIAGAGGVVAVDARIRVAPPDEQALQTAGIRQLPSPRPA